MEVPCHQKPVSYFKYNWSCILRNISLNNNTWSLTHLTENISSQSKASIAFPIRSLLRSVSSMLTFPLRYNFPPWSLRITSWIAKKKSAYAEKVVPKKVELQATFFVRLARSLINLWFSTNQIEETNKQIKLRWREVDHRLMAMLSIWKTV